MYGLIPFGKRGNSVKRNDVFDFKSVFDDFFNDSFFPVAFTRSAGIKADVRETDKEYIVEAEIPGVKKEDIKLDLRDDTLTILVEHNEEVNEERQNYIRKERRTGSFSRSFYVENVKNEDVKAQYKDGILSIELPKSEETKVRKHNIEIQWI